MKFGYTILYVEDVDATMAFYELAFGLKRGMLTEEKDYGRLETGGTTLAFAKHSLIQGQLGALYEPTQRSGRAPSFELGLVTENVEEAHQRAVQAGAEDIQAPTKKPWGQVVSYVRDCNGFLVELCSPMG